MSPRSTAGFTAIKGMIDARHVCRNYDHDEHDQRNRFKQRVDHGLDAGAHELRRVVDDLILNAGRHVGLQFLHCCSRLVEIWSEFAPGAQLIASATADLLSSSEREADNPKQPVHECGQYRSTIRSLRHPGQS